MQLKKQPVSGMKDILPGEMEIRQYLLSKLRSIYSKFGFLEIETPIVEHISNLTSSSGWENEKLIFKVMKRGNSLTSAYAKSLNSIKETPSVFSAMKNDELINDGKLNNLPIEEKERVFTALGELSEEGL